MKRSAYCIATRPFYHPIDKSVTRVVFAARTASVRAVDEKTWDLVSSGGSDELPTGIREELIKIKCLVPDDENELKAILAEHADASDRDDVFYTVIQPTDSCQLGCDYCGQQHAKRHLSDEDQTRIIDRTKAAVTESRFHSVAVCWFGAEPLLGLQVIRALSPRLIAVAKMAHKGYKAKLVTNGVALTLGVATELALEHGVSEVEITLDGSQRYHDARRHTKGGATSFSTIWRNLLDICEHLPELTINIRCNVDRRNADGVSSLINEIADAGIQRRVNFYVASVYSWGNSAHERALSAAEFATREQGWLLEMLERGFALQLLPSVKPVVCLAVMPHGRLVDAYGSVFNCTEVSYVPTYGTPNRYQIGTLGSTEDGAALEVLSSFDTKIAKGIVPCGSCELLPVCGGACPKKWLEGFKPCPSFKENIEWRLLTTFAKAL